MTNSEEMDRILLVLNSNQQTKKAGKSKITVLTVIKKGIMQKIAIPLANLNHTKVKMIVDHNLIVINFQTMEL